MIEFKALINSTGGLFDVSNPAMEKNIGRKMTFKKRSGQGTIHREVHTVVCVQYTYDRALAYRVCQEEGQFGHVARPEDVIWLD